MAEYDRATAYRLALASKRSYAEPEEQDDDFHFFDADGTQAYLFGDILAFRGTEPNKVEDWLTDLNAAFTDGPFGKVHAGFLHALEVVWPEIEDLPGPYWVTGHSLGAALAMLTVAKLQAMGRPVKGLYTFGQPRVGNKTFARAFDAPYFRLVHNNDIVTRIPFFRYRHAGEVVYFDEAHKRRVNWGWREKLRDRIRGRIKDLGKPGTDGIKDHAIDEYLACTKGELS